MAPYLSEFFEYRTLFIKDDKNERMPEVSPLFQDPLAPAPRLMARLARLPRRLPVLAIRGCKAGPQRARPLGTWIPETIQ